MKQNHLSHKEDDQRAEQFRGQSKKVKLKPVKKEKYRLKPERFVDDIDENYDIRDWM